jgi:hypothetical protein
MTDPGNDRGEALDRGSRAPTTIALRDGRTHGAVPIRLDEALKHAVARIENDPRNIEIIISHFGWDGRSARTVEELAGMLGVPTEYIRETVRATVGGMRQAEFVPDVVDRSIELADQLLPILEVELWEALLQARLCFVRIPCDALVAAATIFRTQSPFEAVSIGPSRALVKSGTAECVDQLAARARRMVQTRGCANTSDLVEDFRETIGWSASPRFAEAVARSAGMFEWLDQENGWFWYVPEPGFSMNPLVTHVRRVLAETPRLELSELHCRIDRELQADAVAPPLNVLAAICKRLLFVQLEGEAVVRLPNMLAWDTVKAEAALARLLREQESMRGWLSDGRIFVTWKVDKTILESGVLRVREPMSSFIEGDYELATIRNQKLASIQIRQRACWDTRPLLHWAGAKLGDLLVIIFDRRKQIATGILGDNGFVAQVLSPEINLKSLISDGDDHADGKAGGPPTYEEELPCAPEGASDPENVAN